MRQSKKRGKTVSKSTTGQGSPLSDARVFALDLKVDILPRDD
jgi:hypothetical protein